MSTYMYALHIFNRCVNLAEPLWYAIAKKVKAWTYLFQVNQKYPRCDMLTESISDQYVLVFYVNRHYLYIQWTEFKNKNVIVSRKIEHGANYRTLHQFGNQGSKRRIYLSQAPLSARKPARLEFNARICNTNSPKPICSFCRRVWLFTFFYQMLPN